MDPTPEKHGVEPINDISNNWVKIWDDSNLKFDKHSNIMMTIRGWAPPKWWGPSIKS